MDKDELRAWLRLSMTESVGNDAARRLLACFGSAQAVFEQVESTLQEVVSTRQAQALLQEPNGLTVQCVRTQHWLTHAPRAHAHALWTLGDTHYPSELLQLADPPLLLYVAGQTQARLGNAVSVVGSRNPTPQGTQTAEQLAQALCAAGLCVVSGMALGVDGAAHRGALRAVTRAAGATREARTTHPTWRTVAVVGTGLDRVYPRQHQQLAQDIATQGLLMSEYHLGTPPLAQNFPKRNRLIAALGLGTLVVEAALKSGSLITAHLALELGREVLAVPGSIHATQSHGCHALIRQGAKLVESAQDIQDELQLAPAPSERLFAQALAQAHGDVPAVDDSEHVVLSHLDYNPVSLDALQARCGLDTAALQAQLLTLELDGVVGRLPGGLFQRLGRT